MPATPVRLRLSLRIRLAISGVEGLLMAGRCGVRSTNCFRVSLLFLVAFLLALVSWIPEQQTDKLRNRDEYPSADVHCWHIAGSDSLPDRSL